MKIIINENLIFDNIKDLYNFIENLEDYQSNHQGAYNRNLLVNSYKKLPDWFKEQIKPKKTSNLYRGCDGINFKPAMSFSKNKSFAKFFGKYVIPFNQIKKHDGLIDTEKVYKILSKLKISTEIGDDEGEVIVLNGIYNDNLEKNLHNFIA